MSICFSQHLVSVSTHFFSVQTKPDSLIFGTPIFHITPGARLNYQLRDKNSGFSLSSAMLVLAIEQNIWAGAEIGVRKVLWQKYRHSFTGGIALSAFFPLDVGFSSETFSYSYSFFSPAIYYHYHSQKRRNKKPWALSLGIEKCHTNAYSLYFGFEKELAEFTRKGACNCPTFK
jgi:hypothetical protein